MRPPGPAEIIFVLVVVVLFFGIGRISKVAGEMGRAIKEFRKGLTEDTPEEKTEETDQEN